MCLKATWIPMMQFIVVETRKMMRGGFNFLLNSARPWDEFSARNRISSYQAMPSYPAVPSTEQCPTNRAPLGTQKRGPITNPPPWYPLRRVDARLWVVTQ